MRKSPSNSEDQEQNSEDSTAPREPDLSVAEFEIEDNHTVDPGRASVDGAPRPRRFHVGQWVMLWLVITLGVAAGHLLSNLITSLAAAYQIRVVMNDLIAESEQASKEAQEVAEQRRAEAREQRKETNQGRSLARQCEDWQAAHQEMDTYTTKKNMDKYCGEYREYLDTGRVSTE